MAEYETLEQAYAAVCKERDRLKECAKVLYVCDGKACERPCGKNCLHTQHVEHAENFKRFGNTFVEKLHESKSEWIPVKDALPLYGHNVLFCTKSEEVFEGVLGANGWTGFRWGALYSNDMVTGWMPMPAPKKEE